MTLVSGDILEAALACAQRGWSVIRIRPGTKKAAGKWREYQKRRPSQSELKSWFGNGSQFGLAVVLGEVSGGLVCRDFDDAASYEAWALMFPDLAKVLPTVATSRGRHVYFRASVLKSQGLSAGEYRANGNYVLLPPSRHPTGMIYTWLIPPPDEEMPLVDPVKSGLLPEAPTLAAAAQVRRVEAVPRKPAPSHLTQRTQRFLNVGAAEGHRNRELFCAACDMVACGIPRHEAERQLLDACVRCQPPYPPEEAAPTIASAYSRPRRTARGADDPWARYSIPVCLAQHSRLRPSDKLVWQALDFRQRDKPDCFPSQARIAKDTGLNRDTVNEAIRRLENAGLLTVRRAKGGSNHYATHLPEIPTGQALASDSQPVGESDTKDHDNERGGAKDSQEQQDMHAEHPQGQTDLGLPVAT